MNNELRVPVFRYLLRNPRPFFRNFQLVGFFDAGTAWSGPSPFTEESPLNTSTYTNGPVTVKVNFFRDPIVYGYGAGARLMLFGYFLRVDRAWGVETRNVQDPRWFISLGTDF
jgi:outer membrane translocation and assembly module TamA